MRLKVKNARWEPTEKVRTSVGLGLDGARPRLDRAETGRIAPWKVAVAATAWLHGPTHWHNNYEK